MGGPASARRVELTVQPVFAGSCENGGGGAKAAPETLMGRFVKRCLTVVAFLGCWLCALPPAFADFRFKKGSFTKNSTATPPAQPQSVSGVGFQPKAVIFFYTRQTATGVAPSINGGWGFTSGPSNERAIATAALDAEAAGNSGRAQSITHCIVIANTVVLKTAEAELTSFDADGFTLNWTLNEARADIIHYVALGGTDITNAVADHFAISAGTSPPAQSVALGFQPDFVMVLAARSSGAEAFSTEAYHSIGFATATARAAIGVQLEDSEAARDTCSWQRTDSVLLIPNTGAGLDDCPAPGGLLDTRFDIAFTSTGFDINKIANVLSGQLVHYLALKGGRYSVGSFPKDNVTAAPPDLDQAVAGVGFRPVGVMLASDNLPANLAIQAEGRISFGASDLATNGATWWHDRDALGPPGSTDSNSRTSTNEIAVHSSGVGGATVDAAGRLKSFDSGGFTLTWTANNTGAGANHEILYAAFGTSTDYRSIGTAADDTAGTVNATFGSRILTGAGGTVWKAANRGRGDRITIPCPDPPACTGGEHYTVLAVNSDARLSVTEPFRGTSGSYSYLIARQFTTLVAWEDCIDGPPGGNCAPFPAVGTSLVTDNRSEVGIAYKDSVFAAGVLIDGNIVANTDAAHTITLTTDFGNTHRGIAWNGGGSPPHVVIDNGLGASPAVEVLDDFVTVQGLEIKGGTSGADGIAVFALSAGVNANQIVLRQNLIHGVSGDGIDIGDADAIIDAYNNVIYRNNQKGIHVSQGVLPAASRLRILSNTIFANTQEGVFKLDGASAATVLLQNNIAHSNGSANFAGDPVDSLNLLSSNNLASDATATTHSPGLGGVDNVDNGNGTINFVSTTLGSEDLHLATGSAALNTGANLSAVFNFDIDAGIRQAPWDIGADDLAATTAVELISFQARALDSAVALSWETASELDNLGFQLHRALSPDGPWTRLNSSLIRGLGSSPEGRRYAWTDSGLTNGTTHFYRLEDLDRSGLITAHGPVWATPKAGLIEPGEGGGQGPEPRPALHWTTHGDPTRQSLRILGRSDRGLTLELVTGGFYSLPQADGTSRLFIPGFFDHTEPGMPPLPTRRLWTDAIVGRNVRVVSIQPRDLVSFPGLRLPVAGKPTAYTASDGTYQPAWLPVKRFRRPGSRFPDALARVHRTAFQGETKKAYVELAPLRVNDTTGRVLLARRLLVRLAFTGRVKGETGKATRGRRQRPSPAVDTAANPLARFVTRARGLHAVAFEDVPGLNGPIPVSSLRLSRLGQSVALHVEPRNDSFGPRSTLYFLAAGTESSYGSEAVYELSLSPGGRRMAIDVAGALRVGNQEPVTYLRHEGSFEVDANYLPALLEAKDLWTWDYGLAGSQGQDYAFTLDSPLSLPETAKLTVELQGGNDTETDPDHHVLVFMNGSFVTETRFDGMTLHALIADVPSSLLLEGANTLRVENAGDTGSVASFVYLDRFALEYPRSLTPRGGTIEGTASQTGRISLSVAPGSVLLDVTTSTPCWLGHVLPSGQLAFRTQAGHRYLAVFPEALLRPEVRPVVATTLRGPSNQADWILIAPQALLPAAQPLLMHREGQGLSARAIALEEIVSEFGFGETSPGAVRDFLAFAFHQWARPSPRYLLLLGDSSSDPKAFLTGTKRPDLIPSPLTKSTFLWTASDPLYASVNGEDSLPDFAIGRISAATADEAQAAVQKILDFENTGQNLAGKAVLVADNPDSASDFEANLDDIGTLLPSRAIEKVYLARYPGYPGAGAIAAAKADVLDAFNTGASLLSYVGHGSSGLWASEGLLRAPDVATLVPQAAQPFVLTMTCSSGYFLSPYGNSLSERLVLAADKGAIAAFSPSGLSFNDAAHVFHRALVLELEQGGHDRVGDLVLAAQVQYAASGAFPELLTLYHLFADPALRIR